MSDKQKTTKTGHSTLSFIKDFSKVLVLDGREKVATSIYSVADFVDTTVDQKNWSKEKKAEFERIREEKEFAAKVAPSKA